MTTIDRFHCTIRSLASWLLCPINVTPHHLQHEARWGLCGDLSLLFLQCPRGGGVIDMQIPYISPTRPLLVTTVQAENTMLHVRIRMFHWKIRTSQMPHPSGSKQLAIPVQSPTPSPYPTRVEGGGSDNDRRIISRQ